MAITVSYSSEDADRRGALAINLELNVQIQMLYNSGAINILIKFPVTDANGIALIRLSELETKEVESIISISIEIRDDLYTGKTELKSAELPVIITRNSDNVSMPDFIKDNLVILLSLLVLVIASTSYALLKSNQVVIDKSTWPNDKKQA